MAAMPPGYEPIPHAPAGTTVAGLLTPTGPPVNGYVQLGTLRVQQSIFDDFQRAQRYLGTNAEALDQLYALTHGRTTIDVRSAPNTEGDQFGGRPDGSVGIDWAPRGALRNANGTTESPAMMLLHEMGHANEWLSHPTRYQTNAQPYPVGGADRATWTTPEEKRNIEGLEHRVGHALGEGSRDDHHGSGYVSRSPESRDLPVDRNRMNVNVNGADRNTGALSISGEVTGVASRDGVTTISYTTGGRPQTLSFRDPMDRDENGRDVPHPLGTNAGDFRAGRQFRLEIDGAHHNAALTMGNPNQDTRIGPEASRVYGNAGSRSLEAHDAAERSPTR